MAPQMKKLQQFILDLRNASGPQEEQKRVNVEINTIQSKFSSRSNSKDKREYICKLVYIHLMGLTSEVQFGKEYALELLSSPTYAEKSLGYFAVSVLCSRETKSHEAHLSSLVAAFSDHLLRDLKADSEDINALALQFIASNFNFSDSAAHADIGAILDGPLLSRWNDLMQLVYSLCVSPVATAVAKKAAITAFTVLLKTYPSILTQNDNWVPRLFTLVDDEDPSVVLCAIPLVTVLSQLHPTSVKTLLPTVANRLHALLVQKSCPPDYYYGDVPAPWLVVKLMQLVEHFFFLIQANPASLSMSSIDQQTVAILRSVVSTAIENASTHSEGAQNRNSNFATLFQAVAIVSFLDASYEAIHSAISALVNLLRSPETNTRYLVLDALIKLSARSHHFSFKEHLESIFATLRDRDVSVRKKALDLLYIVCDSSTHIEIISKLLEYFPQAEATLRPDISVKVAVLSEKFATDSMWYVSTMMRLLSVGGHSPRTAEAGSSPAGEVWERIIQIIVNNVDLQKKSAKFVMSLLKSSTSGTPDNLVKVAAFIIGEFGHKLTEASEGKSPFSVENQVQMLFDCYISSAVATRPMVMNALLKVVMNFPEAAFVPDIVDLLEAEKSSLDLETQTRAHEYLKVTTFLVGGGPGDVAFAKSLIRPLPPFVTKTNNLVEQLGSIKLANGRSMSTVNVSKMPSQKDAKIVTGSNSSILSEASNEATESDPFGDAKEAAVPPLSANWYQGYHRMIQFDAGIFYEDQLIKITYRTSRDGPSLAILFTVIHKAAKMTDAAITGFTITDVHNLTRDDPRYLVSLTRRPESTFHEKTTFEISSKIRDVFDNAMSPVLSFSFKCSGSFNTLNLKVPLVISKTLSATTMSSIDEFKKRWLQIGEHLSTEGEEKGEVHSHYKLNNSSVFSTLQRLGYAIIQRTPDEANSQFMILAAGILKMQKSNCGVLLSIKSHDPELKSFGLIVRSTGPGVARIMYETMREVIEHKQ